MDRVFKDSESEKVRGLGGSVNKIKSENYSVFRIC